MNTAELPKPDTIRRFARTATHIAPIDKSGGDPLPPEGKFRSVWMDITPAMAATWLKNNYGNRPVKEDVVTAYARDMLNGVWQATHQGIAFNDEDRLIDGQHRLMAIVKSGKTIRMMVTFGLPSKIEGNEMTVMDCVDRGATRSVADQLNIQHGLKNGSVIAQISSALAHLCFGERVRRLSVGQTLDIYRTFESGVDFVIEHRSKSHGLKSAGVGAAFAFVFSGDDACFDWGGKVCQMYEALQTGEKLAAYPLIADLHALLTGGTGSLIVHSMNKGIAEMVVHIIHQQLAKGKISQEPAEWMKSVEHYRVIIGPEVAKIAGLFKLPALAKAEAAPHESIIGREPAAALVPAKDRPTLDRIFSCVENWSKISKFILTGRGRDVDIDAARIAYVHLARGYGHTVAAIAVALHKTENVVKEMDIPLTAMTSKQKAAVSAIKAKL